MKKLLCLTFILMFLLSFIPTFSVEITSCKSGANEGVCEINKVCTCTLSGSCTDGYLLLYQGELSNPVCTPAISGSSVSINWGECGVTEGLFVNARADCEEGQSSEKTIRVTVLETTTTSTSTTTTIPPETTTTILTEEALRECGPSGYCEDIDVVISEGCQSGYEYCSGYNGECEEFEGCCCPRKTGLELFGEVDLTLVSLIVLAIAVGVIVFLFFISRVKKGTSFEKLYKKWTK